MKGTAVRELVERRVLDVLTHAEGPLTNWEVYYRKGPPGNECLVRQILGELVTAGRARRDRVWHRRARADGSHVDYQTNVYTLITEPKPWKTTRKKSTPAAG